MGSWLDIKEEGSVSDLDTGKHMASYGSYESKSYLSHTNTAGSEKAMTPHSSTLAWKIPWMEEPGRLQSTGLEESDTTERLHFHFSLSCLGEGNGNPPQYFCLENPRNGGG